MSIILYNAKINTNTSTVRTENNLAIHSKLGKLIFGNNLNTANLRAMYLLLLILINQLQVSHS